MDSEKYKEFRNHPFIKSIENNPKWTISDTKKMPLDMYILMTEDRIKGANFYDEKSLASLITVDDFFAKQHQIPANHAYYLDVMLDGFVVLDIEPTCPQAIKDKLLNTPYIYGEISLSGKGIHLVYPTPACFMDFPNAHQKPSIREEHKYYEILLNHFCTFTGNIIPTPENPTEDFNEIYKALATHVKDISKQREVDVEQLTTKPDTKFADKILELLFKAAEQYNRKPDNFKKDKLPMENDMSRYEWAYISYLNWKLSSILAVSAIENEHIYTDEEQAYFLYTVITEVLPHRAKHDTYRTTSTGHKLPWLGYLVKDVLEKTDNSINPDKKYRG